MKAVLVDRGHLVFAEVDTPECRPHELIVEPSALSLNRGEVSFSRHGAPQGARLGWDFSGHVRVAAADGSGPPVGARVVGYVEQCGWAEQVAAPVRQVAVLPDNVSFAQAACLPIAGLTALYAVASHGDVLARRVLITGATGGVGHFAIPLAKLMGAEVFATVRTGAQADIVRGYGADHVVMVGETLDTIPAAGPYDLIVDAVGGPMLGVCLNSIAPDGACAVIGVSGKKLTTFNGFDFFVTGGVRIYDLMLFRDMLKRELPSAGLQRLVALTAQGKLKPDISVERPWHEIDSIADDLINRRFGGKAVLQL